jgi:hypothetical protein
MPAGIVKVKGIPMSLAGEAYVVPPLSLGALEQLQDRLAKFTGDVGGAGQVSTAIDALHAALRRNYPDVTREAVADLVGLENMADVMEAVMDVSGLRRREIEAAQAGGTVPGES